MLDNLATYYITLFQHFATHNIENPKVEFFITSAHHYLELTLCAGVGSKGESHGPGILAHLCNREGALPQPR